MPAKSDPSPKRQPHRRAFPLEVAGQKLKIEWAEIEAYGMYLHDERKILLNVSLMQDSENFVSTLRHEMRHAALAISGISFGLTDDQEEQIVRCMDTIFDPAWDKVLARVRRWMKGAED